MPVPAAVAIGAKVLPIALPYILALLAGSPDPIDPDAVLKQLLSRFEGFLRPGIEAESRAAIAGGARTGSALAQDVAGSLGSLGGGSTGTGRVTRGLASSAASSEALAGGAAAESRGRQAIAGLAAQAFPSAIQGSTLLEPPNQFQSFVGALGGMTAAGGNPFMQIASSAFGSKSKGAGGGDAQQQLMKLLQENPELLNALEALFKPRLRQ